jgi:hypothetical protein
MMMTKINSFAVCAEARNMCRKASGPWALNTAGAHSDDLPQGFSGEGAGAVTTVLCLNETALKGASGARENGAIELSFLLFCNPSVFSLVLSVIFVTLKSN